MPEPDIPAPCKPPDPTSLFISEMYVGEGISNKRFHFAGRGRTRPYKKRTSNLTVILGVREAKVAVPVAEAIEAKEVKKIAKKGGTK